jgi:hypothetical protein
MKTNCEDPTKTMLLLQHLIKPITMSKSIAEDDDFIVEHGPSIFFQIYSVLYTLRDEFTHYDLFIGNVILYEIPEGKYVTMVYHLVGRGEPIRFRTKYIAKIIDYSRCYFKNARQGSWRSSIDLFNALQKELTLCSGSEFKGYDQGYNSFKDYFNDSNINSRIRNQSHDLFFAKRLYYDVVGLDYDKKDHWKKMVESYLQI